VHRRDNVVSRHGRDPSSPPRKWVSSGDMPVSPTGFDVGDMSVSPSDWGIGDLSVSPTGLGLGDMPVSSYAGVSAGEPADNMFLSCAQTSGKEVLQGSLPEGIDFIVGVVEDEGVGPLLRLGRQYFLLYFLHPGGEVGVLLLGSDDESDRHTILPLVEDYHREEGKLRRRNPSV
jgi:hypothetical protein